MTKLTNYDDALRYRNKFIIERFGTNRITYVVCKYNLIILSMPCTSNYKLAIGRTSDDIEYFNSEEELKIILEKRINEIIKSDPIQYILLGH